MQSHKTLSPFVRHKKDMQKGGQLVLTVFPQQGSVKQLPLEGEGFFSHTGVLLGVVGHMEDADIYLVRQLNRILQIADDAQDHWHYCNKERIRIVALYRKCWYIDPDLAAIDGSRKIWVYINLPLKRLTWDQG